jgi:hypothetical protein
MGAGFWLALNLAAVPLHAQTPTGQWDFELGDLSGTVGAALEYADGPGAATQTGTRFGTTTAFGIANLAGSAAKAMQFPACTNGMGYLMPTPSANGGGALVNDYTVIVDVYYPAESNGKVRSVLLPDTGALTSTKKSLVIGSGNGIGSDTGPFHGVIAPNTWHRIGWVINASAGAMRKYIDGAEVGTERIGGIDSSFALDPNSSVLLFGNNDDSAMGYVNSVQIRQVALTAGQMAALGGPSASGIPLAIPAVPSFVENWTPAGAVARTVTDLGAVINPGDASIDTHTLVLKLDGVAQTGVQVSSNGLITVFKAGAGPLLAGTTHTLEVSYTDSQVGLKSFSKPFKAALLFEDFEQLILGPNVDEGLTGTTVWTKNPPSGWGQDDSGVPGVGDPDNDGVTEWAGWGFAKKDWWVETAGDQSRSEFTLGVGTVAIADPDEWDDKAHPKTNYYSVHLTTPVINLAGAAPNSVYMKFDSSWRPEALDDWTELGKTNNQTAVVTVAYNGGAPAQVLRWESISSSPFFHGDNQNEQVSLLLNNPAGTTNLAVRFSLLNAGNDWWWAFDNLEINIGDIPSSFVQFTPTQGATNAGPRPPLGAVINPGTTTLNPGSVRLLLDGNEVLTTVTTNAQNRIVISGRAATELPRLSAHTNTLVYADTLKGWQTNQWSFTVTDYDVIVLGTPVWFENFDGVAEATFPAGWMATNQTTVISTNFDLDNSESAAYENFVVLRTNRLGSVFNARRFNVRPATLNGVALDTLMAGNLAYGESDNRGGNQVQVLVSPLINLTGISQVQLGFKSIYEQNQDSMGGVEYSIDGGATWLPALYMIATGDVMVGDPVATLGTARSDQAWGKAYGDFLGATVDASFGPYISGRVDDDAVESKRIEVLSLPLADNQANVRLRFTHTGTGSWYFGLDDIGFYGHGATNVAVTIADQPKAQSLLLGQGGSLTAGINPYTTRPLAYQWLRNGTNIPGGTSQIYTIAQAQLADAGSYSLVVSNVTGSRTSDVAVVTVVNPIPTIVTQPVSQFVSVGTPVTFTVAATSVVGTVTYQWYKDNQAMADATNASLNLAAAQAAAQGGYYARVRNAAGSTDSAMATLQVFAGSLGDGLVAYLPFDGNYFDYSGRHNHGTPVGAPTFTAGQIGQAMRFITTNDLSILNYVTLGYPADLQFGTNSFSVGFWIKYSAQGDDPAFLSNKDWGSSSNPGWGIFAQSGGNFRVNATGTPGGSGNRMSTTSTPNLRNGNWHYLLTSFWRGQYVATYVDGAQVNATPLTIVGTVDTLSSGLAINIGQDGTGRYTDDHAAALFIDAAIDEVMLWNRVVTPQEVARFYQTGTHGLSPLPVLGISLSGNSVKLEWIGGLPPFNVEWKKKLSDGWAPAGTTSNHSLTITVDGNTGTFRVSGSGQ